MPLAEDKHPVRDLGPGGEHEPFPHKRSRGLRGGIFTASIPAPGQRCVERPGELSGPVADQELLKAGNILVGIHRGTKHQAIVLNDGRVKLAGGESFTSLSSAATYARRTKSANGWDFWQLQAWRERRPLKELRDELIRGER